MADERLIGTWVNEALITSPGGAGGSAALSTVMTMELSDAGAIRQYTQTAGGGADWSSNSGPTLDFEGRWTADGQTLSVMGAGLVDFTPAAAYEFSGDYLVTHSDLGRLIWRRQ